jgi:hypothetical protein
MRNGVRVGDEVPSLFFCGTLDTLPHLECQLTELLYRDFLARVEQTEDFLHSDSHFLNQLDAAPMQQPPAQAQIASVRLEVVAVGLLEIVIVVVLEVDTG